MTFASTIHRIYSFCALDDFILLYPLYNVMFADRGLSILQISSLLVIWSIADIAANIPTGVLADKYSRKTLLAIGQVIRAVGFTAWIIWPNYAGFAVGFILWGIGGTFTSGTFEAIVYDELRAVGREREYVKVVGRAETIGLVANLTATVMAGVAITLGYNLVTEASIVTVLAAAAVAMSFPETPRFEALADTHYFSVLRKGVTQVVRSRRVLSLVLLAGFIAAMYGTLEEYVPLLFRTTGLTVSTIPIMVALTVVAAAIASYIAHRYEQLTPHRFVILLGLSGVLLLATPALGGRIAVVLLVAYTFLAKLLGTVFDGKLQHTLDGRTRATATSVAGFAVEAMGIIAYLLFGLISNVAGNFGIFAMAGAMALLVAGGAYAALPRYLAKAPTES